MSIESLITKHLPGWPQGSPAGLQAAATIWRSVADDLSTLIRDTQRHVDALSASWVGTGKAGFQQQWDTLAGDTLRACAELTDLAAKLDTAATQLENARHKYEVATGAAVVTVAVSVGLTLMTFGASDVVGGEAAAAEVTTAVAEAEAATSLLATVLDTAIEVAVEVGTRFAIMFGIDLTAQAAISMVVFPDHNPIGHLNIPSAASVALMTSAPELKDSPVSTRVAVGGMVGGGLNAASQEVGTGKVSLPGVAADTIMGGVGAGFAGRGTVAPEPAPEVSAG